MTALTNLQRNDPANKGVCKYALIRLDKLDAESRAKFVAMMTQYADAQNNDEIARILTAIVPPVAIPAAIIELQRIGDPDESFVLKLKDQFSAAALYAYADSAAKAGMLEYASAVYELADRAGPSHPHCKIPD